MNPRSTTQAESTRAQAPAARSPAPSAAALPGARPAPALPDARLAPATSWPVFGWAARVLVAAVFLLAAYGKILDPLKFAEEIQNYRLAPIAATHLMAFTLPWIELAAAALLLLGPWRGAARAILIALLAVFTVAKVYVEAMGYPIGCGCFGGLGEAISKATAGVNGIMLNLVLLALLGVDWRASAHGRAAGRHCASEPACPHAG